MRLPRRKPWCTASARWAQQRAELGRHGRAVSHRAQSRAIEESLVRWGIPYIVVGAASTTAEIKDLLAYCGCW